MNSKIHRYVGLALRCYIAWVFITACIHKLASPESFAVDIATYQFLPLVFINPLAIVLPYVELGSGIMLAIGYKARAAALMTSGMMVMFMIAFLSVFGGQEWRLGRVVSYQKRQYTAT